MDHRTRAGKAMQRGTPSRRVSSVAQLRAKAYARPTL
ncbi:hypothetical protein X743_17175 [Mesorhizobium sp. LNHC252B00]|nr:hypothetical protein X743_17175 [Mesorhizobium sp. LNHC252B00]